jgi:hypothetical protein
MGNQKVSADAVCVLIERTMEGINHKRARRGSA